MTAPDFAREPWKHPVVWKSHMVKMARGYPDGVAISIASCECGWAVCARENVAGHTAQTAAINDHWLAVIAEAEAEAVSA